MTWSKAFSNWGSSRSLDVLITAATKANSNMAVMVSSIMVALGTEEATNNTINSEAATAITTTEAADIEVVATEADLKDDMGTSSSTNMEGGELLQQLKPDVIERINML